MADDPFSAQLRLRRRQRISPDAHRGRHLELVSDRWIAELAELVVLGPCVSDEPDPRRASPRPDPRTGFRPSSPA
jgi:hypothetical protein